MCVCVSVHVCIHASACIFAGALAQVSPPVEYPSLGDKIRGSKDILIVLK